MLDECRGRAHSPIGVDWKDCHAATLVVRHQHRRTGFVERKMAWAWTARARRVQRRQRAGFTLYRETAHAAVAILIDSVKKLPAWMNRQKRRIFGFSSRHGLRYRSGGGIESRPVNRFAVCPDVDKKISARENSRGEQGGQERSHQPIPLVFVRSLQM